MSKEKVKIILADDHSILRSGLTMLLQASNMEVIAEVENGHAAVTACLDHKPDVLIIDISMPEGAGLPAIEKVKNVSPETKILVLTMHSDPAWVRSAISSGASGYVVKKSADQVLIKAIETIMNGETYISNSNHEIDEYGLHSNPEAELEKIKNKNLLSEREIQVLKYIAYGYTYQEIAKKLFLSVKSVETYRSRIGKKLNLDSRAKLVRFALDSGLISSDDYV
ncbi:MAG: response regulator transcription factor [Bdellovibrionales bacterium]|nr:response regulator transcription factor [Bdellovibrionales bacterium]